MPFDVCAMKRPATSAANSSKRPNDRHHSLRSAAPGGRTYSEPGVFCAARKFRLDQDALRAAGFESAKDLLSLIPGVYAELSGHRCADGGWRRQKQGRQLKEGSETQQCRSCAWHEYREKWDDQPLVEIPASEPNLKRLEQLLLAALSQAYPHRRAQDAHKLEFTVNIYWTGSDASNPHRHNCRQLVISIGRCRKLEIWGAGVGRNSHCTVMCKNGDVVYLDGQLHCNPPDATHQRGSVGVVTSSVRMAAVLFFVWPEELQFCTPQQGEISQRGGRSRVSVGCPLKLNGFYPEWPLNKDVVCNRCGYFKVTVAPREVSVCRRRCDGKCAGLVQLPDDWNAGLGIV
eukprot:TRINITY_DN106342_c0_g1_i1.p1 TRINITY_DN106342_c0_g1~~TRINITY_DN106342_c0_g1_i1.p1  ORF type:complete len:345 (+),score=42.70 TRINITY_DN106342_c0_g1_i1:24-1058(+)